MGATNGKTRQVQDQRVGVAFCSLRVFSPSPFYQVTTIFIVNFLHFWSVHSSCPTNDTLLCTPVYRCVGV